MDKSGECWIFQATTRNNRGQALFTVQGRPERTRVVATRYAYELQNGPVGAQLLTTSCGERDCVRHVAPLVEAGPSRDDTKVAARFWARVAVGEPNACWEWQGHVQENGYGRSSYRREPIGSHRLAWHLTNGPVPDGMFVCHRCDNPPCCNPAHLFVDEPRGNTADMIEKGRRRQGVRRDRMSPETVLALRERWDAGGVTAKSLGEEFGVSPMTAWRAATRRSHLDVPEVP